MMSDEYTPTTKDVRWAWQVYRADANECVGKISRAEFDRWLAQRDQEAEARGAEKERARIVEEIEAAYLGPDFGRQHDGRDSEFAGEYEAYDEGLQYALRIARGEGNG